MLRCGVRYVSARFMVLVLVHVVMLFPGCASNRTAMHGDGNLVTADESDSMRLTAVAVPGGVRVTLQNVSSRPFWVNARMTGTGSHENPGATWFDVITEDGKRLFCWNKYNQLIAGPESYRVLDPQETVSTVLRPCIQFTPGAVVRVRAHYTDAPKNPDAEPPSGVEWFSDHVQSDFVTYTVPPEYTAPPK